MKGPDSSTPEWFVVVFSQACEGSRNFQPRRGACWGRKPAGFGVAEG